MLPNEARRGALFALLAYGAWGVLPIFWKLLADVPVFRVLGYRIVGSALFGVLLVGVLRHGPALWGAVRTGRVLRGIVLSAALLGGNWFIYLWAVSNERIVEASLGYFITPLANVGWAVLGDRETMRSGQWLSFAFAAIGVAILTLAAGHLPWISLVLAATFSTYGFVRRRIRVPALVGQTMEMVVLAPVAMILISRGEGTNGEPLALLWLAGPLTLLPLILFAGAARRLPYSRLGLFQYIAPTLQLLLAVFLYGEPFGEARLMAFALIWMGIAIYCADYLRFEKRAQAEAPA